ncbi:MAG: hypothetical protein HY466_04340 [Deltaproteobacteria bacterium]|nr:hypothetical protein [Deltaproteobacteria bacterium]
MFPAVVLAKAEMEPTLQQTADRALAYARLQPRNIREWEKKSRKSALLPRLQMGFERQMRHGLDLNVEDSVSVSSGGITVGPAQTKQAQDLLQDNDFEVKAVWYLDQLLFSKDQLDISQEARYLSAERERILTQVREAFFKRQYVLKELELLRRAGEPRLKLELKELERAEATAALDNLTGGWFSAQSR